MISATFSLPKSTLLYIRAVFDLEKRVFHPSKQLFLSR
ncbi:Uncharacterised protein [Segatella copri]|nr:Uncharacterised protein [Segatella copri]